MSAAALQRATHASDEAVGAEFLALAAAWQVLAVELEHLSGLAQHLTTFSYGERRRAPARKRSSANDRGDRPVKPPSRD